MKFGKNLERVVELSDPEWAPFWVNYKRLKIILKDLRSSSGIKTCGVDSLVSQISISPQELAQSAGEVTFFRFLRQELLKCNMFFNSIEAHFISRYERVVGGWKTLQFEASECKLERRKYSRLLAACVKLYKDLLLLENYAIMNYAAFSKILKKHDKITGYATRERYIKNVVNSTANFAHYPRVLKMLQELEEIFKHLQLLSISPDKTSDVELFIGTIRSINDQATSIRDQENIEIQSSQSLLQKCASLRTVQNQQYANTLMFSDGEISEGQINKIAEVAEAAHVQENIANSHAMPIHPMRSDSIVSEKKRCY